MYIERQTLVFAQHQTLASPQSIMKTLYDCSEWQKHFCWLPRVINGERYWLTTVYRRHGYTSLMVQIGPQPYEIHQTKGPWEYGTLADVMTAPPRKVACKIDGNTQNFTL